MLHISSELNCKVIKKNYIKNLFYNFSVYKKLNNNNTRKFYNIIFIYFNSLV